MKKNIQVVVCVTLAFISLFGNSSVRATGVTLPATLIASLTHYIMSYHPRYINSTTYYHEASGCPMYRWYKRYVYKDPSGAIIQDISLDQKSFIGVPNSPQNPVAGRAYGF